MKKPFMNRKNIGVFLVEISQKIVDKLTAAAIAARNFAYAPYSNFTVGAALLTSDDKIFTGCNIESASFSATNCAERTAFFKAISDGVTEFLAIAVVGGAMGEEPSGFCAPCGICRQVLNEFAPNLRIITVCGDQRAEMTLPQLLPEAFGPNNGTGDYLGKD